MKTIKATMIEEENCIWRKVIFEQLRNLSAPNSVQDEWTNQTFDVEKSALLQRAISLTLTKIVKTSIDAKNIFSRSAQHVKMHLELPTLRRRSRKVATSMLSSNKA